MPNEIEFELPITSEKSLDLFLWHGLNIRMPDKQICPNHTTPWHFFTDAFFFRSPVLVVKGSRGLAGKTFTLGCLGFCLSVLWQASVTIMGGSGRQTKIVHDYIKSFWDRRAIPNSLLASDPTMQRTTLVTGNYIEALHGSEKSARGMHPNVLLIDEVDEMSLRVFEASLGQPMGSKNALGYIPAMTVIASTHQHPDGTMTEILRRANKKGWPIYEWCYKETLEPHGWLKPEEVQAKREMMTEASFNVEIEMQEPSPENRAIDFDAVISMFDESLGVFEGADNELCEISPFVNDKERAEYQTYLKDCKARRIDPHWCLPRFRFVTGGDWAKSQDKTVIITIRTDCKPMRVVAYIRVNRRPWPQMVALLDERNRKYKGSVSNHDETGIQSLIGDYLHTASNGIQMIGRQRQDMIYNAVGHIEDRSIISPDIEYFKSELKYVRTKDIERGGSGHLPDSLAALSLALVGVGREFGGIFV